MTHTTGHRRTITATVVAVALGVLLSGCARPSATDQRTAPLDSETAKQHMIDAVDDATNLLGGEWRPQTGPDYAENCRMPDGTPGAHWVYLVRRDTSGDRTQDAANLAERWEAQGMHIDRWGDDDLLTIVGRGGDTTATISLTATPNRYSVEATSLCFPGDPDEL